jgi:conjugative relaxase-like TrwC/TraI family protein
MLSIGKLSADHHAYYELSVAKGRDDYYTGRGEAPGQYLGAGTEQLGLSGTVELGDLKHLFDGTHPRSGEHWVKRQQHDKQPRTIRTPSGREYTGDAPIPTAAFDLTFSAPKSVSVLWGITDDDTRASIRHGHDAAVRAAFDYLERTACVTRRGKAGKRHLRGEGFVAAAFQHRVSRALDPQLHTHVLIANAAKAEGRYTALHGALLYREAKTAGFLYHAVLRSELTKRIGVEWALDDASPHPEIVGVPRDARDLFSKRSDEIQQQLALSGQSGKRAANAAAIDTRAAKQYLTASDEGQLLPDRWRSELDAHGIDPHAIRSAEHRIPAKAPIILDTEPIIGQVIREEFAPTGLTAKRTTFHRRDIIQAACTHNPRGATVAQIERLADEILDTASREIVALRGDQTPLPEGDAETADGTRLTDQRDTIVYTTRELLNHELAIIDTAHARANESTAKLDRRRVDELLDRRATNRQLADEQRAMVTALTTSGAGMEVVVGLAGAGKTFSLDAAHEAWRDAGIEVRGCATALTAAQTLRSETRIHSETIAMLRAWHAHADETGDTRKLDDAIPRRGVLIVDEAGMTETRDLSFLTTLAKERETKLVLVGDHRQLPEIGAGGAFKHLVYNLGNDHVAQLATNRRQVNAWERDALGDLRAGSVEHAVAMYAEQERIVTSSSPEQLREQLAADWIEARERGRDVAMIAYTNADVTALNESARRLLDERGLLGTQRVTIAGKEWAVGDQLIATSNYRALGLSNGTRGTVTYIDERGLEIRTSTGEQLHVPRRYIEAGHASHAYATTGHKTQGMTINGEAFVLATDHINREWLYVTMSRATDQSRVYIDTLDHDPRTGRARSPQQQLDAAALDLYDMAMRSGAQSLARDHGRLIDPQHLDRSDLRRAMKRDARIRERGHDAHAQQRGGVDPRRGGFGRGVDR